MPQLTVSKRWNKAFSANSTATSFATLAPTTTALIAADGTKVRTGIHLLNNIASHVDSILIVQPYGSAAQNKDFRLKLTRWTIDQSTSGSLVYVPSAPFIIDCVLGNIAATAYGASNLLCDTLTLVRGDSTAKVVSPANDEPAEFWLDMGGAEFIEFEIDIDAGAAAATDANALWRTLS